MSSGVRVLVVTNDFPPRVGGINDYVHQLVRRLDPGSATVLASTSPGAAAFDAAFPQRVVRRPVRVLLPTPAVLDAVSRLVTTERPDVVLFGAAAPLALMGATLRRRHGVPYIACTHGFELVATRLPPGGVFLRRLGRTAAAFTVVSRYVRERLMPFLEGGCRVELLPSGIDATRFHPAVATNEVHRRHALGPGPTIVCVSRLVPRKGQDQLIRVLGRVAGEFPDVRLLIVGGGSYERTLRQLTARLGLVQRVVFAGEVPYDALPAYFRAGDIFAMPCRTRFGGLEVEGLGAVFLQAAAVGRACVAGRSGGAPEAVRHGETGLVVDGTNLDELATALLTLLRDPARAQTMGAAGAAWVHGALTWDHMAVRLRDLLTTCAGEHGGGHT